MYNRITLGIVSVVIINTTIIIIIDSDAVRFQMKANSPRQDTRSFTPHNKTCYECEHAHAFSMIRTSCRDDGPAGLLGPVMDSSDTCQTLKRCCSQWPRDFRMETNADKDTKSAPVWCEAQNDGDRRKRSSSGVIVFRDVHERPKVPALNSRGSPF